MEVGAVKQAFNNEVILLKPKLNQARIQIIHKLTRKAKQLAEKKAPEPLKEKLKRKAEFAVNEVMILKKIKPKDIAKFTVTHKGELKDYLNKPKVNEDKACARLLLHKALQDKYKFIRGRFSNVPIQDLFMSRLERRKMKKEAKEKQKNKKKGKDNKVVNSEGDWNVEDVPIGNKSKLSDGVDDDELSDVENSKHFQEVSQSEEEEIETEGDANQHSESENESDDNEEAINQENSDNAQSEADDSEPEQEAIKPSKPTPIVKTPIENVIPKQLHKKEQKQEQKLQEKIKIKPREVKKKNPEQKQKDANRNKMFNEKMQQKKLKKDSDGLAVDNKIVDPFFITSTGENYMSVVEPRGPDEVKDEHKQGNRKLRRAVMFGHVPNIKPRHNNNYGNDNRFNNRNGNDRGNRDGKFGDGKFNNRHEFGDRKFNNRQDFGDKTFNNRQGFNDKRPFNNDFNDRKKFNDKNNDEKSEKLHPSWEAKKKKSGILPFEGKKIVFD